MPASASSRLFLRTARIAGTVALVVVLVLTAWKAVSALILLFGAYLFATLLAGMAGAVARKTPLPYKGALALVGLALGATLAGALWLLGDTLAAQVAGVNATVPEALDRLDALVAGWAARLGFEEPPSLQTVLPPARASAARVLGLVGGALGVLANLVVIGLVGAFFAADPSVYRRGLLHLVPGARRARIGAVLDHMTHAVRRWLVARLIVMGVTSVTTYLGLTLVGVPFALGLALIAGTLAFVPYVGAYVGGSVGVLVALTQDPQMALHALLAYVVIENVQGWTVEPLVEARMTAAPPALLLGAQVVLGTLLGVAGVVLASPLVVCLAVVVQMLYVEDTLGDEVEVLGQS